jgi:hypothetical protein
VLSSLQSLTIESVIKAAGTEPHLDEEEIESFPASDPPSDWAGP